MVAGDIGAANVSNNFRKKLQMARVKRLSQDSQQHTAAAGVASTTSHKRATAAADQHDDDEYQQYDEPIYIDQDFYKEDLVAEPATASTAPPGQTNRQKDAAAGQSTGHMPSHAGAGASDRKRAGVEPEAASNAVGGPVPGCQAAASSKAEKATKRTRKK